ncbi:MAG: DUF1553 domain-containing protein [Ferruginibacter sp.]
MKTTAFTDKHVALGARMAEFAGYNMPISYTGINDEHAAVRNNAGVFDVSHMGEFMVKGVNALELIQRITTNDASKLTAGKAQYSCMPNKEGGIVDDLLVYCLEENNVYMLVVNSGNIEKDWNWISKLNTNDADLEDISDKTCLLAIQGPNATKILQKLTDVDILNLFDFADPDQVVGARAQTMVPTQALYLMNSPFIKEQSRSLAEKLLNDSRLDDEGRISRLILETLNRPATVRDKQQARQFLSDFGAGLGKLTGRSDTAVEGWARYCHAIFASSEFLYRR